MTLTKTRIDESRYELFRAGSQFADIPYGPDNPFTINSLYQRMSFSVEGLLRDTELVNECAKACLQFLGLMLRIDGLYYAEGALMFALGSYTEQEATKGDHWRDVPLPVLYRHLHHEITREIRGDIKSGNLTHLIHDACDAVTLSLMYVIRTEATTS